MTFENWASPLLPGKESLFAIGRP